MSVYEDLMKQAQQAAGAEASRAQQPVVGGGFSGGNKVYQDLMQQASKVGQTGGLSKVGREEEIYNALINPVQTQQPAEPQVHTNPERDALLEKLEEHRANSGWVVDDMSKATYDQTEKKILDDLAAVDQRLGNNQQNYNSHNIGDRIGNTWGASVSGQAAGIANAAGTLLDYGASLNDRSSDFERALADSDMAGWVTDEMSLAAARQAYEAGQLKSNGSQDEVKAAAQKLYGVADNLQAQSNQMLAEAKYGTGVVGSALVDIGKGIVDVAGDTLLSTVVPGLGMARMATGAFGSAAQEARQKGQDIDHQMFAGLKSATIEVLTERIGGPFEKAYGKTALGKAANEAIERIGKNSAVKKFLLKSGYNFLSEGGEEILSGVLNTFVDRILEKHENGYYNTKQELSKVLSEWDAARANGQPVDGYAERIRALQRQLDAQSEALSKYDWGEIMYEGLIGGLTGLVGGTAENITVSQYEAAIDRAVANADARIQAVQEGRATDSRGLIKNEIDPDNSAHLFVANRLASLNEDTAREIVSENLRPATRNAYEQALEDLTDIKLNSDMSEAEKVDAILKAAQEATGAQETAGDISAPPSPSNAATEAPAALNSNLREGEQPTPSNEAQNPAVDALLGTQQQEAAQVVPEAEIVQEQQQTQPLTGQEVLLQAAGVAPQAALQNDQNDGSISTGDQEVHGQPAAQESSREVEEAFNEAVEHFRAVFEDQPVEKSKFINGQNTYGDYSARERADILNAIEGAGRYYVRDGMVVSEREPTTTRTENASDRSTNLPSNFKRPGSAQTEAVKGSGSSVRFENAAELPDSAIKVGTYVMRKNGDVGNIVLVTGSSVFVQFGRKPAEAYGKKDFTKFFRSTEAKQSQKEDAHGGREQRENGQLRTLGTPDRTGSQGIERQENNGGRVAGQVVPEVERKRQARRNRRTGENRARVLRFLGSAGLSNDNIVSRNDYQPWMSEFEEAVRAITPDCPVTFLQSAGEKLSQTGVGVAFHRNFGKNASAGIFVDADAFVDFVQKEFPGENLSAVLKRIAEHEAGHYIVNVSGRTAIEIADELRSAFANDQQALAAISAAFNAHSEKFHKGGAIESLYEEVLNDLFANDPRAFTDGGTGNVNEALSRLNEWTRNRYAELYDSSLDEPQKRYADKQKSGNGYQEGTDADAEIEIEAMLNGVDMETAELERQNRLREQDEFDELRRQDKLQTNAKEWARDQRAKAKAEEALDQMLPKHDPQRDLGAKDYETLQKINRQLIKEVSTEHPKDVTKRVFSDKTYGVAKDAIETFEQFVNGHKTFAEFAEEYEKLEGTAFYEERISNAIKSAKTLIERDENNRFKEIGGKNIDLAERSGGQLSADTVSAITDAAQAFEFRLNRIGQEGIQGRSDFNDAVKVAAKKNGKTGKEVAKFLEKFKGMQLRPDVMMEYLGGWTKGSKFYQLAEDHKNAIKDKQNAQRAALEYFAAATKMKGYDDFATGKTKIENPVPGYSDSEMSLNVALCLLKTLETKGAIEHIARYGAQFAASEAELYNGKNNNGFGDRTTYGQTLSLLSEETQRIMDAAHTGKDIAHARAKAELELKALANSLKAEVMKNDVAKALYNASSSCMKYLARNINDTSRLLWGEDFAVEGANYFPMEWVSDAQNYELLNNPLDGLKGMGIVQARKGDSQPLRIRTFTDVMGRYIDQSTDWAAFSDLSDRLELMSRNNPGHEASLTATIGEQYGRFYADWLDNYVKDLNGRRGETSKVLSKLRSNLASAALTLNGGVALKQSPSYWDAAGVIDMSILAKHAPGLLKSYKSFENNALIQEVEQRTGMLGVRKNGGQVIGEATESARSLSGKVNKFMPNWMTNWITKTDVRTTSNLMLACADQVMADDPDLKQGTNAYYQAVAAKFEEVILKSQPVYTKQARADYMRTTRETYRTLAMFRTQQTQNFNQLVEAIGECRNANGETKKNAAKHLRQVVYGQVAANVMFGILSAVAKAGLHKWDDFEDDEGKFDIGKTVGRVGLNFAGAVAGTLWFGGDVLNIGLDSITGAAAWTHNKAHVEEIEAGTVKKWKGLSESSDVGDSVLSMVNDLAKYTVSFAQNPSAKTFANVAFSASQITGIPLRNFYNMVNSATLMAFDVDRKMTGGAAWNDGSTDDVLKLWTNYQKQSPTSRTKATFKAVIRNFDAGNPEGAYALASTLDYSDDEVRSTAKSAIKSAFLDPTGNMTAEQYKTLMKPIIENSDQTAKDLAKITEALTATKRYYANTSEEQVKADKAAIDEDGNGSLSQQELYKHYLLHPENSKAVEAFWNENEYSGENTLWKTYLASKQNKIAYDRIAARNSGNVLWDATEALLKDRKSDSQVVIQKTDGDRTIMGQIKKLGLKDAETDEVVGRYISSGNRDNYTALRDSGLKPADAMDMLLEIDSLGNDKGEGKYNGSVAQAEIVAYYKLHPEMEEYIAALWNAQNYTKNGEPNLWDSSKIKK